MKKLLTSLWLLVILNATAQITPLWNNTQFGSGDNSDRYNAIVSDGLGNFYMGGYTYNTGKDKDYLIVKTNNAGDTLWTRQFNGAANGSDKILYMAMDASGNVYATGQSDGGGINQNDIVTQKYNSSGVLQWTSIYNNATANQDDQPRGISVDNSGNVFITGSSDRDSLTAVANDDILTLKYTTNGVLSWSAIYNGTGNATDRGNSIVADNTGGCIITGRTATLADDDVITIKYSTTGTATWTTIYNRGFGNDRGENLTSDASGNIYVVGRSASASDYDIVTLMYNSSGVNQWTKFYNNADDDYGTRIFTDASGNVYVAGQSDVDPSGGTINYDIATIKYNSTGVQQWAKTFGNAALNDEDVSGLLVDASGNVYITGKSDVNSLASIVANNFITIKYNSTGVQQWAAYYDGSATNSDDIAEGFYFDGTSYLYVAGGTQNLTTQKDASIIKYDVATGISSFVKSFNGKGDFTDKVQAMIVDSKKNTFVTGYVYNPEMRRDLFVAKINSSGATVWFKTYDFSQDDDEGRAITLDTSKNIYVAGQSIGSGTSDDYITIKFDSLGNTLWTARYDFANEADVATGIVVNPSNGIVFVTGYSDANISSKVLNYDIATIKYTSAGSQQSVARYNGSGNGIDRGVDIVINPSPLALSTFIVVTGKTWNGTNYDIVTIKYGNGLGQQWATKFTGVANKDDEARDIFYDGTDLYVAGNTGTSNGDDIFVAKYNASGVQQWTNTYNGTGNYNDIAYALTSTTSGLFVTGRTAPSASGDTANLIVLKYDKSTGAQQWATIYNGSGNGMDRGNAIGVDLFGNIYSAGESAGSGTGADIINVCLDPTGRYAWNARYNGAGNGDDVSRVMAVDASGYLYAAGYSFATGNAGLNATTLKYCPPPPSYAGADVSICPGSSTQLLATGGTTYSWSPSTGLSGTTIANPIATPLATTSYVVTVDNGLGCSRNDTVVVSINSSSIAGTASASPSAVCSGSTTDLTLTGSVGSIQWQNSSDNINFSNIAGATSSSYTTPGITAITYYRASVQDGSCSPVFSNTATVTVNPASIGGTATANPNTLCGTGAATVTLTGFAGAIQWQSSSDNVTFTNITGATSSTYTNTKVKATTYYKASVTNGSCASAFSNIATVTVNPKATATITASGPLAICNGDSVMLTANSCTCTYQWKKGSNILAGETNISYTVKTAGTYKVTVTTDKGCSKTSAGSKVTIVCKNGESLTAGSFDMEISVSPNPTASTFNIQFESTSTDVIIVNVFNILGEKVFSATTLPSSNLNFGNEFASGVYFVRALQGNNEKVIKIIKQD